MLSTLQNFCQNQGLNRTYWIAYSGGMDSHVLLHLFSRIRSETQVRIRAIYIHHGLSQNAGNWAQHCKSICDDLQIDFIVQKIDAQADSGESPEEIARERRYAALSAKLAPEDCLVTAHHQDDQAETLLIQLFRGAGPKGLAAMPMIKKLGEGLHARPLLNFSRDDFQRYATGQGLRWIEDESNANCNFSRNFIRHKVMPVIRERWPAISTTLTRVSQNCAEAQQLLEGQAEQDLSAVRGSGHRLLSLSRLSQLSPARQRQVLRLWIASAGQVVPGTVQIHQIQRDILRSRGDKTPHMSWESMEIRRFRDDLYLLPPLANLDASQIYPWDFINPLIIPGLAMPLTATLKKAEGIRADIKNITIRFRQGGEVCRLPGRTCRHSLKKLFQEWQIPYWQRDRIPLVYAGDELISAVGYFLDENYQAKDAESGYVIDEKHKVD